MQRTSFKTNKIGIHFVCNKSKTTYSVAIPPNTYSICSTIKRDALSVLLRHWNFFSYQYVHLSILSQSSTATLYIDVWQYYVGLLVYRQHDFCYTLINKSVASSSRSQVSNNFWSSHTVGDNNKIYCCKMFDSLMSCVVYRLFNCIVKFI